MFLGAFEASLFLSVIPAVASITCFLSSTSLVRRDVIQIIPGKSLITCQGACINDPACTAIQITGISRNCVLFGADITPTIGSCPAPFTCMLKTTSGCIPKPRRPIDLGYVADYCSGAVQSAPADDGSLKPCGTFIAGNQTVYIDALLHDGTNKVLENYNAGFMTWDDGLGSWFMSFQDDLFLTRHYFLAAKCVRPQVAPDYLCQCGPLPLALPAMSGYINPSPVAVPSTNVQCPAYIQFSFLNIYDGTAKRAVYKNNAQRHIYCANRVWMEVTEAPTQDSYAITAASCVTPSPG